MYGVRSANVPSYCAWRYGVRNDSVIEGSENVQSYCAR
ncbi:hypothetical protein chiPu_0027585, partial [Chiloscyllium punctatum]|nr:hypothetical protein [Chiloscyllium punctatum]